MLLDLSPIRPAVLPLTVRELVNDLRASATFSATVTGSISMPVKVADLGVVGLREGPVKWRVSPGGFGRGCGEGE
jgi:hypothetical protein